MENIWTWLDNLIIVVYFEKHCYDYRDYGLRTKTWLLNLPLLMFWKIWKLFRY